MGGWKTLNDTIFAKEIKKQLIMCCWIVQKQPCHGSLFFAFLEMEWMMH